MTTAGITTGAYSAQKSGKDQSPDEELSADEVKSSEEKLLPPPFPPPPPKLEPAMKAAKPITNHFSMLNGLKRMSTIRFQAQPTGFQYSMGCTFPPVIE